jgi:hypothetical protein
LELYTGGNGKRLIIVKVPKELWTRMMALLSEGDSKHLNQSAQHRNLENVRTTFSQ